MMRATGLLSLAGSLGLVAALAACGSSGSSGSSASATSAPAAATGSSMAASSGVALRMAKTPLGTVVVDSKGRTIYQYDKDTQGTKTSACVGSCVGLWPAVYVTGTPKVSGVTGKVGTISAAGGKKQLTLNGWPLYYYAGDSNSGQVNGQGVDGIWWVLTSSGNKIHKQVASSSSNGGGGGYGY